MQITPTGGAAGTGVSEAKLRTPSGHAEAAAGGGATAASPGNDSAVIRELAVADLLKLTQILQPAAAPERVMRVESLLRETVEAIGQNRMEWAVGRFIEAATTDPARVDDWRGRAEFEPIRDSVENLLVRLTQVAKMDAESKLEAAEQVLERAGWQKLPHWETSPAALIQIGHRLIEAGGYANYIRTAELAANLQSAYWGATIPEPVLPLAAPSTLKKEERTRGKGAGAALALAHYTWNRLRERLPARLELLWTRAPLLVLLSAWFTLGLAGGLLSVAIKAVWPDSWMAAASDFGFRAWGLGFLALVGVGFWARVRNPRP